MRMKTCFAAVAVILLVSLAAACATPAPKKAAAPKKTSAAPARGIRYGQAPAAPPAKVCGSPILNSIYSYNGAPGTYSTSGTPAGLPTFGTGGTDFPDATSVVVIPAGDNSVPAGNGTYDTGNTVYYFEPGTHILTSGIFTGDNAAYVGGYTPGNPAIIDGKGTGGLSASTAGVLNAYDTWEYLTIRNYESNVNNGVLGDVNADTFGAHNTYKYNTIGPNEYGPVGTGESSAGGYAIVGAGYTTIVDNCFDHDAQGAFNDSGADITITGNEIAWNGLGEYPDDGGPGASPYSCGCSGGGKLFFSWNAVITGNYVHDNYNTGIWLDFDNAGANISGNYVASNWGEGISLEASYNASISDNTLVGNGWASDGPWPAGVGGQPCFGGIPCSAGLGQITGNGGGLPYGVISTPNSGGNANLNTVTLPNCSSGCTQNTNYSGQLLVQNNVMINNFGGMFNYTDTDRYPGNLDNDSACSVPLGVLNQPNSTTYYHQTYELQTFSSDAAITGNSVTSAAGTTTLCTDYGVPPASDDSGGGPASVVQAPSTGMGVFNINTGTFLGNVATVTSANAFTLDRSPGNASGLRLMLSGYGGCGPADYYAAAPGVTSGTPAANYWDNCVWGGRDVTVSGNINSIDASVVTGCTTANLCGFTTNVAFLAGVPQLMKVFNQYVPLQAYASGGLGNVWSSNTYQWSGGGPGQWQFSAGVQGNQVSAAQWMSAPYGQDAGSTFTTCGPQPQLRRTLTATPSGCHRVTSAQLGQPPRQPRRVEHPGGLTFLHLHRGKPRTLPAPRKGFRH